MTVVDCVPKPDNFKACICQYQLSSEAKTLSHSHDSRIRQEYFASEKSSYTSANRTIEPNGKGRMDQDQTRNDYATSVTAVCKETETHDIGPKMFSALQLLLQPLCKGFRLLDNLRNENFQRDAQVEIQAVG
ncbi:unnamed protein product [Protopolystoma xenopodis]|uniref:Uncharacterized protein n=1 Tax=Protopolystoma xenopodis TaxID=117903 RepID=A0A448WNU6_9PLAT|nr:unnamed protein product [Protopolystoma xenopodis]